MDDLRQLSDLIGRVYDASVDPNIWPEVVERTAKWLEAPKGILMTPLHPPSGGGFALSYGVEQTVLELWGTHYYAHDVWVQRCQAAGLGFEGNVVCGHEYISDEEFHSSVIYRECLSFHDIAQVLTGIIFDMESPLMVATVCAVYRGRNDARFGEREKYRFNLLIPHLSRALGVMMRLRDADFRVAASRAALDRINSGVILFATGGGVTFVNAAARRIIEKGDGLKLVQKDATPWLQAHHAETSQKLNAALAAALDRNRIDVPHFSRCVVVPRHSQMLPYSVQFSALSATNEFGIGAATPQAIAFVSDCAAPARTDAALLRQTFGLTPAEARAALALCEGGGIEETAVELGISANTLKTQMNGIYQKTGVDNRARLVKLVLALAGG